MLLKPADDKNPDLQALQALSQRPDATAEQRKRIEQEIRNIQSGIRGEQEAAYEIEFHYGKSRNWMSIHDLRLECEGRVAQIDHLLINRVLECYVCESKRFAEGVAINDQGEFTAFFNGRAYGVPSPLEQNRRHIAVLESVFKTGQVPLPPPPRTDNQADDDQPGAGLEDRPNQPAEGEDRRPGRGHQERPAECPHQQGHRREQQPNRPCEAHWSRHARGIRAGTGQRTPPDSC